MMTPEQMKAKVAEVQKECVHILEHSTEDADKLADRLMGALNSLKGDEQPNYGDIMVGMALFAVSIMEQISEGQTEAGREKVSAEHVRNVFSMMLIQVLASPAPGALSPVDKRKLH